MKVIPWATNLYRGPRPKHPFRLMTALPTLGTVISLQSGIMEIVGDDENSGFIWELSGIREICVPFSDWERPSAHRLAKVVALIIQEIVEGRTVYIHCKHGVDRTGMVCAAYDILVRGFTAHGAKLRMHHAGFHRFPYFYWESVLDELATPKIRELFNSIVQPEVRP